MRPRNRLRSTCFSIIAARVLLIALGSVVLVGALPAQATEEDPAEATPVFVKWSTGFDFSRGDYGLEKDTTLYYVPLSVTIDYDRFRARVSIPFLVSSGPIQIDTLETITDSGEQRGLGQLRLAGSYLFDPLAEALPYVELSTKVTAPTETSSSLGTGLWAVALQADLFQRLGRITPYLSVGRKFYIECGCDDRLKHRFYTSVGASFALTQEIGLGIAYDWLEAARKEASDSHEIVPYASLQLNQNWSIGPYAVFGLSDGSPDYGVGFSLSVRQ
jgi:hypothetical protein